MSILSLKFIQDAFRNNNNLYEYNVNVTDKLMVVMSMPIWMLTTIVFSPFITSYIIYSVSPIWYSGMNISNTRRWVEMIGFIVVIIVPCMIQHLAVTLQTIVRILML